MRSFAPRLLSANYQNSTAAGAVTTCREFRATREQFEAKRRRSSSRADRKWFKLLGLIERSGGDFAIFYRGAGGEGGIRTLDRVSPIHAFQACALNHSATSPTLPAGARSLNQERSPFKGELCALNHSATSPTLPAGARSLNQERSPLKGELCALNHSATSPTLPAGARSLNQERSPFKGELCALNHSATSPIFMESARTIAMSCASARQCSVLFSFKFRLFWLSSKYICGLDQMAGSQKQSLLQGRAWTGPRAWSNHGHS